MSRTHHASKDARRTARKSKTARVDLDAMRPFMDGWRAQVVETYSREEIERMKRGLPSRPQTLTIGD
jgi:hypothetical protein